MKTQLRCGMAAIVLLGGVGLAAAQTSPKGSPGTNDNMLAAPMENSGSAQPAGETATAKPKSAKHAKTTHHKHHGT